MMPFVPCPNRIPSGVQLMPNGLSIGQSVTGAPPATSIFLSVRSPAEKNAIDRPSGAKDGDSGSSTDFIGTRISIFRVSTFCTISASE